MALMIDDLLAGEALHQVLAGTGLAVRKFLRLPPRQRLFFLLWKDFGSRTSMGVDEFYAFATDIEMASIVDELLAGTRVANDETRDRLSARIALRLHRVPEDNRDGLARDIAGATLRGYPLVMREWKEYGQLIATKLDVQHAHDADRFSELQASIERVGRQVVGGQADLAAALLSGPLAHAGQEDRVRQAQELASSDQHAEAASLFQQVADALDDHALHSVAETYRLQAADLLAKAGDLQAASDLAEHVVWAQLDRASADTWVTVRTFERLRGDDWLTRALSGCADWPHLRAVSQWLRDALEQDDDLDRSMRWLSMLLQVDVLTEGYEAFLDDLPDRLPTLVGGDRLHIELDRIDALEELEGPSPADAAWQSVEAWSATQPDPRYQGLCWQRQGYLLARRGDVEATRLAYRRAMAAWSRVEQHEEQVADCLFSLQAAESLLGIWNIEGALRPLAASMESAAPTPAGHARRLQERAATSRIAGRFRDAHREYWLALAAYRRTGSLQGTLHVCAQLGELYVATNHADSAVEMYVLAGNEKNAVAAVKAIPASSANDAISSGGPRWQRAAMYRVLSELGTQADPGIVSQIADQLLKDAAVDPPNLMQAAPAAHAKQALASVALQMPEERRDAAYEQIKHDLTSPLLHDAAQTAALSLLRATQLGVLDARENLIDCFVEGSPIQRVDPQWLPDLIRERPDLRQKVIKLAEEGRWDAVEVLLWVDVTGEEWTDLTERASELARIHTAVETLVKRNVDDRIEVTQSTGARFELGGLAARRADEATRSAFIDRMLAVVSEDEELEENRRSAAGGLFNVAGEMSGSQREQTWRAMLPLARGDYRAHGIGSEQVDLLSMIQIASNFGGTLQAAAVELLGRLWDLGLDAPLEELEGPIREALRHRNPRVRAAAVDVLGRVELLMDSAELLRMLPHEETQVRVAIVRAVGHRDPKAVVPLLSRLTSDSDHQIRWVVIEIAEQEVRTNVLAELASRDPDSYVRGLARLALDRLASEGPEGP